MTPCNICGCEAIDPDYPWCPEHLQVAALQDAFVLNNRAAWAYVQRIKLPSDLTDAVNATLDLEELDLQCRFLMAAENVILQGFTVREASELHDLPLATFRHRLRKHLKSRSALCMIHPGRCPLCE